MEKLIKEKILKIAELCLDINSREKKYAVFQLFWACRDFICRLLQVILEAEDIWRCTI